MWGTVETLLIAAAWFVGVLACIPLIFWLDRFGRG